METENDIHLPKEVKNKFVETYSDDMVRVIANDKEGLVQKIIHEQEKNEIEKIHYSPKSKINRIFLFASILLFFSAVGGLVYFFLNKDTINKVEIAPQFLPLIFNDKTQVIDVSGKTKDEIEQSVLVEVNNSDVKSGGLEGLYLIENKKPVNFSRFVSLIRADIGISYKDIINENMLIGVINNPFGKVGEVELNIIKDNKPSQPISIPPIVSTPNEEEALPNNTAPEGEVLNLTSTSFFKTGTSEFVDALAKEKVKKTLGDFLDTVDFATSKIQVIGTYSVERYSNKNEMIAEARRQVGMDILEEVFAEKYTAEQIAKITIESSAKGLSVYDSYTKAEVDKMTNDEYNKLLDGAQGIMYIVEAKTKTPVVLELFPIEPISLSDSLELVEAFVSEEVPAVVPVTETPDPKINTASLDFFILIKTRSFTDVFPILKSWETKMFFDLHGFFDFEINAETNYLLTKDFEDKIVQNKNARILYDKNGSIVLMYVYLDDNSVVFTRSEQAVKEIISRLASSKIKK